MDAPNIHPSFEEKAAGPLIAKGVEIFQINLGYRCNLECRHCHVEAGPNRPELMTRAVMETCLRILQCHPIPTIDITGGAPEMHPDFPWFLEECALLGRRLLVRTNGVILLEREYEAFIDLYARNRVEVVLSFPHVDLKITNRQRGEGVYPRLIEVLRKLNERGYGQTDSGLIVNLVHNPAGASLPGPQNCLENLYRQALQEHQVVFNHLFCITNMPIGRYLTYLKNTNDYEDYMTALVNAFNQTTLESVMCKTTLSIAWDGKLYDCDFNQMLGMTVNHGAPDHIAMFDLDRLANRRIVTGNHCYGCTACAGSSCRGEIA
jgi:radical SAM/Cys-rich protein